MRSGVARGYLYGGPQATHCFFNFYLKLVELGQIGQVQSSIQEDGIS